VTARAPLPVLERLTNGALRATPHRVLHTPHARASIIRFNALAPEQLVAPLPQAPARPPAAPAATAPRAEPPYEPPDSS
jgi:isopenicillin N synthase-like dioxygenase